MNLTIAQALRKIKKVKGLISEESAKMKSGISYTADSVPEFRFAEAVTKRSVAQAELIDLESKVAVANAINTIDCSFGKVTLSKAIRYLQELKGNMALYKELIINNKTVKERDDYFSDEQGKYISCVKETVNLSDLSETERENIIKGFADTFESLNNLLEDANHKTLI